LFGIATFKLVKGLFFIAVALGIYTLSNNNLPAEFRELVRWFHLDPETKFFTAIFKKLDAITEANMLVVAGGTFAYATLALVEAVGLFLRYSWAAYLTIAESAIFIPIEVYELTRKITVGMSALLALNILIVIYLWRNRRRLFRHHRFRQPDAAET